MDFSLSEINNALGDIYNSKNECIKETYSKLKDMYKIKEEPKNNR